MLATKITGLRKKIAKLGDEMHRLADLEARAREPRSADLADDPDARSMATSGPAPASSAITCKSRLRTNTI